MRLLADESCDFTVVRDLRVAGHDVLTVGESCPGAEDDHVMNLAAREGRILIPEDKDFGQLVYASGIGMGGVILLRYPATVRANLSRAVVDLVGRRGETLAGRFVVLQPGRVRIGRRPGS